MRCASGASYAIAFKMVLLSLVWLPQVPARVPATDLDISSSPPPPTRTTSSSSSSLSSPPAKPTQHYTLSSSSLFSKSMQSSDTASSHRDTSGHTESDNAKSPPSQNPLQRTAITTPPGPPSVFTSEGDAVLDRSTTSSGAEGALVYYGSSGSPGLRGTDLQSVSSTTASTNYVCDLKCGDVMARKQGICGCNAKLTGRPFLKSGIKRSALHRPMLN
ncbi:proline-rich receptor-like protein kinase PERK8 [Patiria miniata]|uniref:Uncharacterized protein n=1 Tax=Patiria miniata TaxID=46514 RepID=A0A913Z164_PATMI|nr:proline-rich receptor-like protein kinase PERK8 [Patiria miniata]